MRDPDTIEREIAVERDRLVRSLRALDEHLSPEMIVRKATERLRGPASGASDLARENPLALALIGTGVAWMVAGSSRRNSHDGSRDHGPAAAAYDPRVKPTSPGLADPRDASTGFDTRVAAADAAMRQADKEGDDIMSMTGTGLHDPDTDYGYGYGYGGQPGRRERMRRTAEDLRHRLQEGLDDMPDRARARILAARRRAMEVQETIEERAMRASENMRGTARDNPLLVGAIAFGVGAAMAAALPRTSAENRNLGTYRDRLLDEADRIFHEETAKLRRTAEAAVAEGKEAVKDTLRSGPPDEDDPVERVSAATRDEAKRQGVGKIG
ncbi:MAG: DUF3618 domain-containing protein [Roseicyclus sp.]